MNSKQDKNTEILVSKKSKTVSKELTQSRLKQLLYYNQGTGVFTRRRTKPKALRGSVAGNLNGDNYLQLSIDGKMYLVHILAWLYVYGEWPKREIDHINGRRSDNRIKNIRDVSHAVNMQNRREASKNNSTGLLGVSSRSKDGKHYSRININGDICYLGTFATAEQAHNKYIEAKRANHEGCTI